MIVGCRTVGVQVLEEGSCKQKSVVSKSDGWIWAYGGVQLLVVQGLRCDQRNVQLSCGDGRNRDSGHSEIRPGVLKQIVVTRLLG